MLNYLDLINENESNFFLHQSPVYLENNTFCLFYVFYHVFHAFNFHVYTFQSMKICNLKRMKTDYKITFANNTLIIENSSINDID